VELNGSNGNKDWSNFYISGNSIVYNGPALASGSTYGYVVSLQSSSACNNPTSGGGSYVAGSFTYSGGGGNTSSPTVPAGVGASPSSPSQINLSWTASTDNVGVTGYKVYRNGVWAASPAATNYSDTGLTAATGYNYTVAACNAANNCSAQSSAVSATTMADMVTLNFAAGWNLFGNSIQAPLAVSNIFNDPAKVDSVWKWVATGTAPDISYPTWAFYAPAQNDGGRTYAAAKGYEFLGTIDGGEGFWLNAKTGFATQLPAGNAVTSTSFQSMTSGWHLISTSNAETPGSFNTDLSSTPPAAGGVSSNIRTLWAWDSSQSKWYFYAPSLEAQGGSTLSDFISGSGYLNFTAANKTLGPGVGFWVNKP